VASELKGVEHLDLYKVLLIAMQKNLASELKGEE
jgi:hypothetical protein